MANKETDPRQVALSVLHATAKQGGWSEGILKKSLGGLDTRDGALATRLCFGVLQNQGLLDFYLGHYAKIPLKRMELMVVLVLRLGAYQILFMDKIPNSAAVDSAVTLTKKHSKNQRASGMVNAILRNLVRDIDTLPQIPDADPVEKMAIEFSHPKWLVEHLANEMPMEELSLYLAYNNGQPPITAMVNTTKATTQEVTTALTEQGVVVEAHPWLENCLRLSRTGNIEMLTAFQKGLFYIQDPASRLTIEGGVGPGATVLDACAAPGGKSMAMAIAMNNQGRVTACDLHPHKKKLIEAAAKRLHLDCVQGETADGKIFRPEWEGYFDVVLVDAPCSGLGVIAKKPDIRYKEPEALLQLPQIQSEILQNCSRYVKKGGLLIYSTCTILKCENQEVVEKFIANHPMFSLEPFTLPQPIGRVDQGQITLLPHKHDTDGFFMARLRKK